MEYKYRKSEELISIARLIKKREHDVVIEAIIHIGPATNTFLNRPHPYKLIATINHWNIGWQPLDVKNKIEALKHVFKGYKINL